MADISKIKTLDGTTYDLKDATARSTKVDKTGDSMTGNLIIPAGRVANTFYGISFDRSNATPVETILYTGIRWISSSHMPVIHMTGYAYGSQSPIEFKIGFYIYSGKIGYCGVTNMGAWSPNVYLFKYTRSNVDYVAVGLAGSCYFLQLSVDVQDEMGKFNNIVTDRSAWSWSFLTSTGTIPSTDDGTTCVKVPYKANILNPSKVNGYTVNSNVPADAKFTDTTYESKAAASGGTAVSLVTTGEKYTWNNKGTYSKPSGGIPDSDIASAATWNAKGNGTITGIKMNGSSKGTSGVVDLGTVITEHQDISGKADKSATVSTVTYDSTNKKITKTINGTTSDVVTASTLKSAMALNNVENKSSATIRGELTKANVTTALGYTPPETNTTYTANTSKLVTTTVPNITSVGSATTLGTAISASHITAWSSNTPTNFEIDGEKLVITSGSAAALSYDGKSIPNVTSAGTAPTLGTAITVATGGLAANGGGSSVVTGITGS